MKSALKVIVPLTVLQSWAQGETVWGQAGMRALWGAATVKVVGPGMDDERFAESLSRLLGEHDVPVASYSRGGRDHPLSDDRIEALTVRVTGE